MTVLVTVPHQQAPVIAVQGGSPFAFGYCVVAFVAFVALEALVASMAVVARTPRAAGTAGATTLCLMLALAAPVSASDDDPLEMINRPIFVFNDTLDRFAIRPIAKGYDTVMPPVAQRGVNNFFANLYDVTSALNSALQWRWDGAAQGTARFLLNSTLGVVGIFDVATPMGVEPRRTDFGHTLAIWGVPEGPYVMVPLLGPRTFRSGTGTLVDTFVLSIPPNIDDRSIRNAIWGTELIHLRAQFLESDELISGDRYIFLRDAYLQQRASLVNEGEVEDSFSNFEDDWVEDF